MRRCTSTLGPLGRAPSGEQYGIAHGDQRATIVEVGGGVREYSQGRRPVLDPYEAASMCDGAHGTPLIPWPNRLADGRYRFDGRDYQVALTEPAKHNAIHGFLRWRSWRAIRHDPDRVVMATTLFPQTGYPFLLDVAVDYRLTGDGLVVTTMATNAGDRACPYGCGQHPYLSPGSGLLNAIVALLALPTHPEETERYDEEVLDLPVSGFLAIEFQDKAHVRLYA